MAMVLEFLTPVAGWAVGKVADTVWDVAIDQVKTKAPTDRCVGLAMGDALGSLVAKHVV